MITAWLKNIYRRWLKWGCARHGHHFVNAWVEAPYFVTRCMYCGKREQVPIWPNKEK